MTEEEYIANVKFAIKISFLMPPVGFALALMTYFKAEDKGFASKAIIISTIMLMIFAVHVVMLVMKYQRG